MLKYRFNTVIRSFLQSLILFKLTSIYSNPNCLIVSMASSLLICPSNLGQFSEKHPTNIILLTLTSSRSSLNLIILWKLDAFLKLNTNKNVTNGLIILSYFINE